MKTRMEKRKRDRRQRGIKFLKLLVILALIIISGYGIMVVNETIAELEELETPNVFKMDLGDGTVVLFGKSYYIDLRILKRCD
ncbi:MAG: hypothetical protein GX329_03835 [Tissierellia bacterium]|nr:hypothetical protein [Tissierellia bacterium]